MEYGWNTDDIVYGHMEMNLLFNFKNNLQCNLYIPDPVQTEILSIL